MILALDPGQTAGWALSDRRTGAWSPSCMDYAEHVERWFGWLGDMISENGVETLIVERAIFVGRTRGAELTTTLMLTAHAIGRIHGLVRREAMARDVRKALFGPKVKPNDAARVQMARDLGFDVRTDHAADAALLLRFHEMREDRAAA